MRNKKIKLIASFCLIFFCLIFLNSCKKTDLKPSDQKKASDYVIHYSPANIKVNAGFIDKNGNEIPFSSFNPQSQRMMDNFTGCGDHSYLINLFYNGFVAEQYTYGGDWTLIYTWTLEVPAAETTPTPSAIFNKGFLRFPNAPFGISTAWRSTAINYGSPTNFTITDQGQTYNMERYTVTYTFTLSDAHYCILENFHTYFRIATDCEEFPLITYINNPSYIVDQLTPQTYNVYNYGALNNGSNPNLDQFDTYPLIPSPPPCHAPSTSSPTHKIQYRKQGNSTWTEVTSSNLATVTVNVTSTGPGTYEYQSKGLLDGSGNYSPWSATSTVIVY